MPCVLPSNKHLQKYKNILKLVQKVKIHHTIFVILSIVQGFAETLQDISFQNDSDESHLAQTKS